MPTQRRCASYDNMAYQLFVRQHALGPGMSMKRQWMQLPASEQRKFYEMAKREFARFCSDSR